MISAALHDIVHRSEFRDGLAWGCLCAVLGGVVGLASIAWFRRPAPIAGLLVVVALVNGARHSVGLPSNVTHGLLLLAVAGVAADVLALVWRPLAVAGIVFAIPGASLLTSNTGLPDASWIRTLVVVTVTLGGTLVADFDRRHQARGWSVVMYAVSVVGVYFTVPDTERALVLLGASLPLLLLGWPVALASLGRAGSYCAVGALAWIVAFEGIGRRSAIVGGVACLGLFVVEPVARLVKLGAATVFDKLPESSTALVPVALAHLALVFVASRLAGLVPTVRQAAELAVADLVVALAIVLVVDGEVSRTRRRRASRDASVGARRDPTSQ
jgi:hypothetical protein